MFGFERWWVILLILAIVLIVYGPGKLPGFLLSMLDLLQGMTSSLDGHGIELIFPRDPRFAARQPFLNLAVNGGQIGPDSAGFEPVVILLKLLRHRGALLQQRRNPRLFGKIFLA